MEYNPASFSAANPNSPRVANLNTRRFPVEMVSWNDSMAYCAKVTDLARTRRELSPDWKIALPTEAQWEYACRAGTVTPYHFGTILNGKQANMAGTHPYGIGERGPYLERTAPVGSYPPNAWNMHDMHGNVWEWCLDGYRDNLPGGVDPFGGDDNPQRVIRGGGWGYIGANCRAAARGRDDPTYRINAFGFRPALVLTK